MSTELNMESEREAFEAWAIGPEGFWMKRFLVRDSNDEKYTRDDVSECWAAWQAARRTAPVSAPIGENIEDIPLPPPDVYYDGLPYYTRVTVDRIIAPYAERIRQLERELAERKPASVDTPEFHALVGRWLSAREYYQSDDAEQVQSAWAALIAYIDGRTAAPAKSIEALVREVSAQLTGDVMEHVGLPAEDGDDHGEQNYLTGKFAGITMFERVLLKLVDGRTAGTAQAPVEEVPRSREWQPVTGPGQVRKGDKLRFKIGGKDYNERAKLILHPGTNSEEVIYDKGRNFYFITSCVMSGFSNHKCVEVLAAAPSPLNSGKEETND